MHSSAIFLFITNPIGIFEAIQKIDIPELLAVYKS